MTSTNKTAAFAAELDAQNARKTTATEAAPDTREAHEVASDAMARTLTRDAQNKRLEAQGRAVALSYTGEAMARTALRTALKTAPKTRAEAEALLARVLKGVHRLPE